MAADITPAPEPRELDMLLTAGERIAMSLLAIAVNARGCRAASLHRLAGRHHHRHAARPGPDRRDPPTSGSRSRSSAGNVVIVAGFQGLSTEYDITTLGRGGSDTTAVAMAAALGAEVCEIYTDVDGVFTADPRIAPRGPQDRPHLLRGDARARRRGREGPRSCGPWSTLDATACRLHVRKSFGDGTAGTWVMDGEIERHARERADPRRRPGRRGGQGHPRRGARPPRRSPPPSSRPSPPRASTST